jgi:hypothetical protein
MSVRTIPRTGSLSGTVLAKSETIHTTMRPEARVWTTGEAEVVAEEVSAVDTVGEETLATGVEVDIGVAVGSTRDMDMRQVGRLLLSGLPLNLGYRIFRVTNLSLYLMFNQRRTGILPPMFLSTPTCTHPHIHAASSADHSAPDSSKHEDMVASFRLCFAV